MLKYLYIKHTVSGVNLAKNVDQKYVKTNSSLAVEQIPTKLNSVGSKFSA
jgi:hypothetical protein